MTDSSDSPGGVMYYYDGGVEEYEMIQGWPPFTNTSESLTVTIQEDCIRAVAIVDLHVGSQHVSYSVEFIPA